ncbi:MAG: DNA topoisomerase IB, partial [Ferruginibacter sp.]|nr:DNA topoisomerase IB [Ferruginibacter sp.]
MTARDEILELLPKKQMAKIIKDPVKTAEAANLVYVTDTTPGIVRQKKAKDFFYALGEEKIKDEARLKRIKSLVIPPAWENVWIC